MLPTPYAPLHSLSKVNFKYKKWGYYKKWDNVIYQYFTKIETLPIPQKQKPFIPRLIK